MNWRGRHDIRDTTHSVPSRKKKLIDHRRITQKNDREISRESTYISLILSVSFRYNELFGLRSSVVVVACLCMFRAPPHTENPWSVKLKIPTHCWIKNVYLDSLEYVLFCLCWYNCCCSFHFVLLSSSLPRM